MATLVAPLANPRANPTYTPGSAGTALVPVTMSPAVAASRRPAVVAPQVRSPSAPAARPATMAPIAFAQAQYEETGSPLTAFASGWINASAAREEQAAEEAKRQEIATAFADHPDLQRYVTSGAMEPSDALRIKEGRDEATRQAATAEQETALAAQRRGEIGNYLTQLTATDERYGKLADGWAAGLYDEESLAKALADLDGTSAKDDETFAMQPTYYKVTDPESGTTSVKFGQMGSKGTFKETALPPGAEPAIPVTQLNTETGFQPVTKFGDVPANAPVTPIDNEGAAFDTAVGKGKGELEVELPAKRRKAAGALNALERQQGLVGQDIDKAVAMASEGGLAGLFSTGFLGDLTKSVAGSPGYDLFQTLQTIKANIGFDRLQEMRNNSPTGGALGAISDKETSLLQAVNGALEQGQSRDQFVANLERIRVLQAEVLAERREAFANDFGGVSEDASAPIAEEAAQPDPSGDLSTMSDEELLRQLQ